ncbi:CaiB/BaiF CoA-transferase family protein [Sporosarcina sp. BI001-red]|uniref:CaiB/BaiF CoA transferase family protein n=1 Tax=Sporosarcina sp. BI001-red TaxID=2282866 RepID=UPI001313F479|nr:CoA transferase [Sporosarcina sp. BI001-red]
MNEQLPLQGLKILDISTMLAAPWVSTHLADFGAEVLKIEHPEYGDHARKYGAQKDGKSVLWKSLNRNKKSITLNFSKMEGQELLKEIIKDYDVMIENFRPGTLEKWNLSWEEIEKVNPNLILLRVSGFGQKGPYSERRGFGTVAEGMSGFTSINGDPTGPPILPGIPLADGLSGIAGALMVMIATYSKQNHQTKGQVIDLSLYEPLMRLLEPHLLAYDQLGIIANRVGNGSSQTAPRNAYPTKDGNWVALSASAQSIFENLCIAIDREDLIINEKFNTNKNRLNNVAELDEIISGWIVKRDLDQVVEILNESGAVVGPMYNVKQLYQDPHYTYRESFVSVTDDEFGEMRVPNVLAKLSKTPGKISTLGPKHSEHTIEFLKESLKMGDKEISELKRGGII